MREEYEGCRLTLGCGTKAQTGGAAMMRNAHAQHNVALRTHGEQYEGCKLSLHGACVEARNFRHHQRETQKHSTTHTVHTESRLPLWQREAASKQRTTA